MPRARSAWHKSRPSASGRPMSITNTSGTARSTWSSAIAPVPAKSTAKPSSRSPRPSTPRSSTSSSTSKTVRPEIACVTSLLAENRAERQAAQLKGGKPCGNDARYERDPTETGEKHPGECEVVGRRVEDVLQHRDEHLREQPPEHGREREGRDEHDHRLAPEERRRPPHRGAQRQHRGQLLPAFGETDADEERHSRRGEDDEERLLDPADPAQLDGRDRAHGLH